MWGGRLVGVRFAIANPITFDVYQGVGEGRLMCGEGDAVCMRKPVEQHEQHDC